MTDIRELLNETLIKKGLSPEQAAGYIGCSGMQVRRWIKKENIPGILQRKAIEEGIKRIKKEVPSTVKKHYVGRIYRKNGQTFLISGEATWGKEEFKKLIQEDHEFVEKLGKFKAEFLKKVNISEAVFLRDHDYWTGFQEIFYMAYKYGVKLPEV